MVTGWLSPAYSMVLMLKVSPVRVCGGGEYAVSVATQYVVECVTEHCGAFFGGGVSRHAVEPLNVVGGNVGVVNVLEELVKVEGVHLFYLSSVGDGGVMGSLSPRLYNNSTTDYKAYATLGVENSPT